jgi:hypothetical protein
MVGGVELIRQIGKIVQSIDLGFIGHKKSLKVLARMLNEDTVHLDGLRRKRQLSLNDKAIGKF